MKLTRSLAAALLACFCAAAALHPRLAAADSGFTEGSLDNHLLLKAWSQLEDWQKRREEQVDDLIRRGATQQEAEAALDERIRLGTADAAARKLPIRQVTPLLGELEERLAVYLGVASLPLPQMEAVLTEHGLTPSQEFYNCLCPGGFWYAPSAHGPCEGRTQAYATVIHAPFVATGDRWRSCAFTHAAQTGGNMADQLVERVRTMTKLYEKDVCAKLEDMLAAMKAAQAAGGIKPPAESLMAKGGFEQSFFDLIAGTQSDGVIEAILGGLSDRLAIGLYVADDKAPTGLGVLLTDKDQPSNTGILSNPYVYVTKVLTGDAFVEAGGEGYNLSYEMELARRIFQSEGELLPGDVFRMAVETTKGDLPLAMLVAHNLLKEAAYAHRHQQPMVLARIPDKLQSKDPQALALKRGYASLFDGQGQFRDRNFEMDPSLIRARLQDVRPYYDPHVADRLGPWYHIFGLLFSGTNPVLGENFAYLGAATENATRLLALGSTRSLGKEAANRCASKLVGQIAELLKKQ